MGLTRCPECQGLCFTKDAVCASCSREFRAGELQSKLAAEERSFARKSNSVFAILLFVLLIILFYVIFHPNLDRTSSQVTDLKQRTCGLTLYYAGCASPMMDKL